MKLVERNGTFYLVRHVPRRYSQIEPRKQIWITLKTDSISVAEEKSVRAWDAQIAAWEAEMIGDKPTAEIRHQAARDIAHARGFHFIPVSQVSKLPIEEILERVEGTVDRNGRINYKKAGAYLGLTPEPKMTLTKALELYWPIAKPKTKGKNANQIRRWENPRKKAIANFIKCNGDVAISEINADMMLDFKDWLYQRIEDGKITNNTANKDLVHFGQIVKTVVQGKRLNLSPPVTGYAFSADEPRHRPPFSTDWIRAKILEPGALDRLNGEARAILLGMINTGYRPSEGSCLGSDQIRLDCEVPHISIEPVGRTLKNSQSRRVIPLLGVSLEAFQMYPNGFPTYASSDSLSGLVNKYMGNNGLRETKKHSLYSLRHSFEDRMLAADIDERVRVQLFGHKMKREKYGSGATLEHMQRLLKPIAL